MTKKQWIDFIRNILDPSGDSPRFRPQMVEWAITQVTNQLFASLPESEYENFDFWTKEYKSQTATYDSDKKLYYISLPASVVPLKIPSEAVRYLNGDAAFDLDYVPCTETIWAMMDGLFSYDTSTVVGYIVRYDKIWMADNVSADAVSAGFRLVIAVPFSEFSSTEEVNIPFGNVDITQLVIQMLSNTQPMNLKNNNA